MSKKVLMIIVGTAVVLSVGLAMFAQPAQAEAPCPANRVPVCWFGHINDCVFADVAGNIIAWDRANGLNSHFGFCGGGAAKYLSADQKHEKWVRFDSTELVVGSYGWLKVTFTANNITPTSATLQIDGVGTFTLENLSCEELRNAECTGWISGVPVTGEPEYHGGLLTVNGKYQSSAAKIFTP